MLLHSPVGSLHTHRAQRQQTNLRSKRAITTHAQAGQLAWNDIQEKTTEVSLGEYHKLPEGSRPGTSPSRVLTTSIDSLWSAGIDETHPVLLIRDTEGWCPYCERVWLALEYKGIDYDTMFINLRDKPEWFLELVPTGLVPVAKVKDDLVHESYDILKVLEHQFPSPPLLPEDKEERAAVLGVCDDCNELANAGFGFMREGRLASDGNATAEAAESSGQCPGTRFEEQLAKLEQVIAKNGGPFIFGKQMTLADVMYVPSLERFAAQLPIVQGLSMRDNPSYPHLASWYKAMDELECYQKVKGDDRTTQLLMKKVFNMEAKYVTPVDERTRKARLEAAAKLGRNHRRVLDDILKNSGILRERSSQYGGSLRALNGYPISPGPALVDAVDHALRRVCHQLIEGTPGERHDCKEACAIGSAALVFFRNRISAPRDMTAAAATELREACSAVLLDMF